MIYLKTKDTNNGITDDHLYFCWGDVHRATFSPNIETLAVLEFKTHGKTYEERRENLHNLAVEFSHACGGGFSWLEEITVISWFEKNGKRYGLTKEFKDNGII